MKKILLIALTAAVVLGVGVLSVDHYQTNQNKNARDAQVSAEQAAKKAAAETQAATARQQTVQAAYDKTRVECEKGAAAYDKLTPFAKGQTTRPVCGPAVLQ